MNCRITGKIEQMQLTTLEKEFKIPENVGYYPRKYKIPPKKMLDITLGGVRYHQKKCKTSLENVRYHPLLPCKRMGFIDNFSSRRNCKELFEGFTDVIRNI